MRPYKDKPKQTAMSLLTQVLDKAQKSEIFIKEGIYYEENLTLTRDIIKGKEVICLWEQNQFYGGFLRQWMIDGNDRATKLCKYLNKPLLLDCSNGLLADFEGSIKEEFFIVPLGLNKEKLFNEKLNDYFFNHYMFRESIQD